MRNVRKNRGQLRAVSYLAVFATSLASTTENELAGGPLLDKHVGGGLKKRAIGNLVRKKSSS